MSNWWPSGKKLVAKELSVLNDVSVVGGANDVFSDRGDRRRLERRLWSGS